MMNQYFISAGWRQRPSCTGHRLITVSKSGGWFRCWGEPVSANTASVRFLGCWSWMHSPSSPPFAVLNNGWTLSLPILTRFSQICSTVWRISWRLLMWYFLDQYPRIWSIFHVLWRPCKSHWGHEWCPGPTYAFLWALSRNFPSKVQG